MDNERRPKILLAADDEELLFAMHRVLYVDHEHYDVLLSPNGAVARAILHDQHIDVLITDANPPVVPGSDLITWVSRESPHTVIVLLMDVEVGLANGDELASPCVRFASRPVEPNELLATVRGALRPVEALSGKLSTMPLIDVVQLLCGAGKSVAVKIRSEQGRALVLIAHGEIVHARTETQAGIEALVDLVGLRTGTFHVAPLPDEYEATLTGKWRHLLMEAARRLDERTPRCVPSFAPDALELDGEPRRPSVPPDSGDGPTALFSAPEHTPSTYSDLRPVPLGTSAPLVDAGFAAVRAGDLDSAWRLWSEALALDPTNRTLALNLRKLKAKARDAG